MSLNTNAAGYSNLATEVRKMCQADVMSKKAYIDFMCQSYGAGLGMQKHLDLKDLEMGVTVHYNHYTQDYDLPDVNHWNNGFKDQLNPEFDRRSVNACNIYGYQLKLSQRDYQMLKKNCGWKEFQEYLVMALVAKRRAIFDSYVPAIIVGGAGFGVGTAGDPVTATATSYQEMFKEIVIQAAQSEMVCNYEDSAKQIAIYLPFSMLGAHLDFWNEKTLLCPDGIRKSMSGYSTPYGFHVEFVNDRFLPRDAATGNVLGFWVNRGHVGVVNKTIYEDWFNIGSDMIFEGEFLYDSFLLNCKAAGVILTDQKPTCQIIC